MALSLMGNRNTKGDSLVEHTSDKTLSPPQDGTISFGDDNVRRTKCSPFRFIVSGCLSLLFSTQHIVLTISLYVLGLLYKCNPFLSRETRETSCRCTPMFASINAWYIRITFFFRFPPRDPSPHYESLLS